MDKQILANQPIIILVGKKEHEKLEHEKLEKYKDLKEELQRMWSVKAKTVFLTV